MGDVLKVGFYVLLLLPGFVFVQVFEYHLLREKKPQLEKTLEIILYSALLWLGALALPFWWPWAGSREICSNQLLGILGEENNAATSAWTPVLLRCSARFFLAVSLWSFVLANLWGLLRKWKQFDARMKWVTGRNWYPGVAFEFFQTNLDRPLVVTVEETKYLGLLYSAPDTVEDKYIILTDPHLVQEGETVHAPPQKLALVEFLLIKVDEIKQVQALQSSLVKKQPEAPGSEDATTSGQKTG